MKAIVHIGTEKTGTTSIQRFLYQNRKALKNAGYHFVQSAGTTNNRALPAYCVSDDAMDDFLDGRGISTPEGRKKFRDNFLTKFESELASLPSSIHTVVISSEHFHSRLRSEAEIDTAYKLLSTYFEQIKIVCYLREQGETCTSYYSTALRTGETRSFSEFMRICRPRNHYYNYYEMLNQWAVRFGAEAMDVSLFQPEKFLNQDLLDDFTTKIDPALVGALDKRVKVENESLRPTGQALARAVNIAISVRTAPPELLELREKLQVVIYRELKGRGQQPTLEARKEIFDLFIESNEKLRESYFADLDALFESPTPREGVDGLVDDGFIDVLVKVLKLVKSEVGGVIAAGEYSDICAGILSCITDITTEEGKKPGKEILLTEDDARILKNAALRLEMKGSEYSERLMKIAAEILPSPQILQKLEEYAATEKPVLANQYLICLHIPESERVELKEVLAGKEFRQWLGGLTVPLRGYFNLLRNGKTFDLSASPPVTVDDGGLMAFTVFEAESQEEAEEIAGRCPIVVAGGSLHISEIARLVPNVNQI